MKLKDPLLMKNHRIWKDKRIPEECKYIYTYIYTKALNLSFVSIQVGEFQQVGKITSKGLKKALVLLEKLKYIIYDEYDKNRYSVKII